MIDDQIFYRDREVSDCQEVAIFFRQEDADVHVLLLALSQCAFYQFVRQFFMYVMPSYSSSVLHYTFFFSLRIQ